MDKNFYTVNEFHDLTGKTIAKTTIYKYVKRGKIPAKRFGDRYLILSSFVNEFLKNPSFSIKTEKVTQ